MGKQNRMVKLRRALAMSGWLRVVQEVGPTRPSSPEASASCRKIGQGATGGRADDGRPTVFAREMR